MKRVVLVVAFGAIVISGCASLIGASFDDAGLVEFDAGSEDVHDAALKFDVADTKPFDPSALPNLALWLDAHQQIDLSDASNQVATWHDLSGHLGRDGVAYPNYGVPTFAAAGINGQPSVHFEPSGYQMLQTNWVGPGSTEFTLVVVTQGYPHSALRFQNAVGGYPGLIFPFDFASSEQAPNLGFLIENSATDYAQVRSGITASATIAVAILRSTGTITTYTNGSLVEQRLSTTKSTTGTPLFIGGLPVASTGLFTHGDIGEVIVYDNALSDIDRSRVEDYLSIQWSIAL
jgi:hypothetical protein